MTDDFHRLLRQYWGYEDFRGIQLDIIQSIAEGKDTLGLMPTGGGKSITFQVPALAKEGTCIVITPLIALMKDQVQHLKEKGIKAAAIYSGMSRREIVRTLENCIFGGVKLLYVSPERLSSQLFLTKLRHMLVSFITVDEAHCISQWGYDFRPSYLRIAEMRKLKPEAPVLALTATATRQVTEDIQDKLLFQKHNVISMSFERQNLAYVVRKTDDKIRELIRILSSMKGSAIVYVRSRRRSKDISALLEQSGISSTFYHAGLDQSVRDERQQQWQADEKRVMVATNAFGMGIDKADVRLVIHLDSPDSIEAYFQEAGRAGRDGEKAYAVLLWNGSDAAKLHRRVSDNFPSKEFVNDVYSHLAYYYQIGVGSGYGHTFSFDIGVFCFTYHFYPVTVDSALHLLENAGYLHYETDPDASARAMMLLSRNDLYQLDSLTKHEDDVMMAMLRLYGGLFTDYQYIDVALIAKAAEMSHEEAYQILKSLSARHIMSFIPQRRKPYITLLTDREDEAVLPPSVYEERKEQFIKRIEALIAYASNDNVCRSRQLLLYFGEERTNDCGICDVCLSNKQNDKTIEEVKALILRFLGDKEPHSIEEVKKLRARSQDIVKAMQWLIDEDIVRMDGLNAILAS